MIGGAARRLKAFYLGLPPSAGRLLFPFRFLLNLARSHDLVLLEGEERSGGKPLRIACTDTAALKDYLLRRAFRDGARERPLGKVPSWTSAARIRELAPEADLLFWYVRPALGGLPRAGALARLPAWVYVHVDLSSPECLARGKEKFTRSGNALKKAGFAAGGARGEADFADFYERLFLPYVQSRHGENAVAQSREETLDGLRRGGWELLVIRRGDEIVAGVTVEISGPCARFWQMGVRDGDPGLLAEGVSDAAYHHMLAVCRERGVKVLNLGSCRPFAADGVLEYKRRFGGYVAPGGTAGRGFFDLDLFRMTPGAADFLAANPLIAAEPGGGLSFRGFARGSREEILAQTERWRDRYCFMGGLELRVTALEEEALSAPNLPA